MAKNTVRLNFLVDKDLHSDFALYARTLGRTVTDLVIEFMTDCVNKTNEVLEDIKLQDEKNRQRIEAKLS